MYSKYGNEELYDNDDEELELFDDMGGLTHETEEKYNNEELYLRIDAEGIHETFYYSVEPQDIEDPEVRQLAAEYVRVADQLTELINSKVTEESVKTYYDEYWA